MCGGERAKSAIRNATNDTWPRRGRHNGHRGRFHGFLPRIVRTPSPFAHNASLTSHFGKEDGVVNAARDIATGEEGGEGACRSPKSPFGRPPYLPPSLRFLTTTVARIPI